MRWYEMKIGEMRWDDAGERFQVGLRRRRLVRADASKRLVLLLHLKQFHLRKIKILINSRWGDCWSFWCSFIVPPLIDAFLCTRPLTRSLFNCIGSWGLNTGENENDQTMFKQEWTCSFKLGLHLWIPCWWISHVFEILSTFARFCFILPQQSNNHQRGRFYREEKYLALEKRNKKDKNILDTLFISMSLSTCGKIEFGALFAHFLKWTTRTRSGFLHILKSSELRTRSGSLSHVLSLGENWSDWSPIRKFLSFSLHLLNILLSKRFMLCRNVEIKIWKAIASFEKVI